MPDPIPTPAPIPTIEGRVSILENRMGAVETDVNTLKEDDKKFHGVMDKITGAIENNPKLMMLLNTVATAGLMWLMSKIGAVPGVTSSTPPPPPANPAPNVRPLEKERKESPSVTRLEDQK